MKNELDVFWAAFSPEVAALGKEILGLAEAILLPGKKMWIDHADKMLAFGTEKTMKGEICYIKPLKDSVNLGFFHGATLNDPHKLLQGSGKMLRHIKFKKGEIIQNLPVKELLRAALQEHNDRQQ